MHVDAVRLTSRRLSSQLLCILCARCWIAYSSCSTPPIPLPTRPAYAWMPWTPPRHTSHASTRMARRHHGSHAQAALRPPPHLAHTAHVTRPATRTPPRHTIPPPAGGTRHAITPLAQHRHVARHAILPRQTKPPCHTSPHRLSKPLRHTAHHTTTSGRHRVTHHATSMARRNKRPPLAPTCKSAATTRHHR